MKYRGERSGEGGPRGLRTASYYSGCFPRRRQPGTRPRDWNTRGMNSSWVLRLPVWSLRLEALAKLTSDFGRLDLTSRFGVVRCVCSVRGGGSLAELLSIWSVHGQGCYPPQVL